MQNNRRRNKTFIPNITLNGKPIKPVLVELGKMSSGGGLTSVPYGSDFNPLSSTSEIISAADGKTSMSGLSPRARKKQDSPSSAKKLNAALLNSPYNRESSKRDKSKSPKSKKRTIVPENYDLTEQDRMQRQIMFIANY